MMLHISYSGLAQLGSNNVEGIIYMKILIVLSTKAQENTLTILQQRRDQVPPPFTHIM